MAARDHEVVGVGSGDERIGPRDRRRGAALFEGPLGGGLSWLDGGSDRLDRRRGDLGGEGVMHRRDEARVLRKRKLRDLREVVRHAHVGGRTIELAWWHSDERRVTTLWLTLRVTRAGLAGLSVVVPPRTAAGSLLQPGQFGGQQLGSVRSSQCRANAARTPP
jgi:hypothetical protein